MMAITKGGLAAAFACSCLVASAATWSNFTANTPDTAYSWNDPGNWEDGDVGGEGESVTILPTAIVYIRVPDGGVTVHKMRGNKDNSNAIFIGGPITLKSNGTLAEWTTAAQTFCDIVVPEGETIKPEIDNLNLRGHIINHSSIYVILRNGSNYFRCDYFAEAAGETRTTDLVQAGNLGIAGGVTTLYAPEGSAAASGTWRLVAGSPYATRVSSTAHKLAVGTTVTAAGYLPSGTFLKRVFDTATIELSEPAAAGGDVTLSFAAFTADFTARVPNRTYQHGTYGYFLIRKYGSQDICRMVIEDYRDNHASGTATVHCGFSYDNSVNNGTLVFRKVTVGSNPIVFDMKSCYLEFAGDGDTGITTLPDGFSLDQANTFTAHLKVTNNITGVVGAFTNFRGIVAKDGGGLLKVGLADAENEGSLVVNEGTLQIVRNATVAEGAALSANKLTIKSGATFTLPEGGMTVNTLSFENGAVLSGSGELVVENGSAALISSLSGLTRVGGATVRVKSLGEADALQLTEPSHDAPAGHPAFWLDASRPDTVTTNAVGGVTRWNDCRVGEPMFCTNIASACPTYVYGDSMKKRYVKMSREANASTLADTQVLVWSVPIDGIKAVFLVQDPTDFGGEILGRTARCPQSYYNSAGTPYYRSTSSLSWSQPLVVNSTVTSDCVRYGRFFLNGVEVNGATTGYLGAFMQLVEHHVNTNYNASATRHDLICDAFGTGCETDLKYKCGMRIAEYVIYTNSLTYAERLQTAQYLCRKWLGRNVYWTPADNADTIDSSSSTLNGDALDVADGKEASAGAVSSGTLVKDGGGTLYVNSLGSDALIVRAGEVMVGARGREHDVPHDSWLHVDATEADTIVKTNAKNNAVHSWADVNGIGRELRSIRQQRDKTSTGWPLYTSTSTINGLACVDLGARQTSNSGGLVVFESDGKISEGQDAAYSSMTAPEIKTFFVVYDSTAGGGTILGGVGSDFPKKGMPRMWYSDADRPNSYPICYHVGNSTVEGQVAVISNACENGTAEFVRNGVVTNPCTALFLKGPERMSFRLSTGRKCAVFGAYGGSGIRGDYFGGLKYGEIICFERFLSDAEVARVNAYLAKKWFNADTPGYDAPSAGALRVASGAKVTLLGDEAISATTISGGGMVDGDLVLSSGIALEIGASGSLPCFNVTGAADLSSGGTVTITGKFRDLKPGAYTILSASSLSFGGDWSVSADTFSRTFELSAVGDTLVVTVFKKGTILIFK